MSDKTAIFFAICFGLQWAYIAFVAADGARRYCKTENQILIAMACLTVSVFWPFYIAREVVARLSVSLCTEKNTEHYETI